jgi:acyl carrier protein phosphodiesterase
VNHLAHALLAGADDALLLGSLLGDFWRGAPDPAWSAGVRAGVVLHRNMDVFTDSHPVVAAARASFDPPWRRYAGILIDVYFDHALARDWAQLADPPLAALSQRTLALLEQNAAWLPPALNRFAGYFRAHGLFAAYARRATIENVLVGIGTRLRHANRLAESAPVLWQHAAALDAAFARFFPDLEGYARVRRVELVSGEREER